MNITAFYLGQQVQEPHCQYSPLWMMTKTMIMNTMNMTNITAYSKGEQVQEPPCQHSPLRVFQSMFAATQVDDDDKEADDDDCKVDDDDNKFLFFVSKLLAKILK